MATDLALLPGQPGGPAQENPFTEKFIVDFLMIFKGSNFLSSLMNEAGLLALVSGRCDS